MLKPAVRPFGRHAGFVLVGSASMIAIVAVCSLNAIKYAIKISAVAAVAGRRRVAKPNESVRKSFLFNERNVPVDYSKLDDKVAPIQR